MSRRWKLVLGVVVLVSVAGCSSMNPLSSGPEYPDGYDDSGITDPQTAASDHYGVLNDSDSFTMEITFGGLPNRTSVEMTSQFDLANEKGLSTAAVKRDDSQVLAYEEYQNGSTLYEKAALGIFGTQYNTSERSFDRLVANNTNTTDMKEWMESLNVTPTDTREIDGTTYREFNVTSYDDSGEIMPQNLTGDVPDTTLKNGTMLVSPDGVIRSLRLQFSYDGGDQQAEFTYRISKVGNTSVSPPEWLEEAKSSAPN
ncbi:DUF7537 family lipoprotein [Halocatena halophila]|uniref:DUF7537 family lipoprotein n=1 Tax=Halocatena halophila TaxID=2814576 RepID=UPI002ED0C18D